LEQAKILNLSAPGCLLETPLPLRPGEYVQLRMSHVPGQPPLFIELAAVRWVDGWKAGLEFIRMSREDEARLRHHVGFHPRRHAVTWSEPVTWSGVSGA
jgi:hypothetical protein